MLLAQSTALTVPIGIQLGVGGIFVILVLRMVFDFVSTYKARNDSGGRVPTWAKKCLETFDTVVLSHADIKRQIGDLHDWHSPDAGGEQAWKNRQMVELLAEFKEEAARGTRAIENNNRLIERITPLLSELERE